MAMLAVAIFVTTIKAWQLHLAQKEHYFHSALITLFLLFRQFSLPPTCNLLPFFTNNNYIFLNK